MSVAWYIVLEKKVAGCHPEINGKAMGHSGKLLNGIAKEAGVTPLMDFFATSPGDLATFANDNGIEMDEGAMPAEKWFRAEDGLKTVSVLIKAVSDKKLDRASEIVDDLRSFERVLQVAKTNGVRWHLAVDF